MGTISELDLGILAPTYPYRFVVSYLRGPMEAIALKKQTTKFEYDLATKEFEATIEMCATGETEDLLAQFCNSDDRGACFIKIDQLDGDRNKFYSVNLTVNIKSCKIIRDYASSGPETMKSKIEGKIIEYKVNG